MYAHEVEELLSRAENEIDSAGRWEDGELIGGMIHALTLATMASARATLAVLAELESQR
jgi:hypothetical protein